MSENTVIKPILLLLFLMTSSVAWSQQIPAESSELPVEQPNLGSQLPAPTPDQQTTTQRTSEDQEIPAISKVVGASGPLSGLPPIAGTLRDLADGEAPDIYTVEPGDTLFDICDQLLDEGGYWPKLWALNPFIKNPHFIWPGMRLRFYPGNQESPPFLEIVEEEDLIPVDKADISIDEIIKQDLELSDRVFDQVSTEVIGFDDLESNDEIFVVIGNIYNSDKVQMTLPGFILSERPKSMCSVISGSSGEAMVMEGMDFVCNPQSEEILLNQTLTVLRFAQEIEDESDEERIGFRYQFVAHVRLGQVLEDGAVVQGKVLKSRLGVEMEDIVVPYMSTKRMVSLNKQKGTSAPSQGKIIAFDREGVEFGGEGSMVFLNRGKSNGFEPGNVYQIRQFMHSLVFNHILDEYPHQTIHVGNIRIVDSTQNGSVGYISENFKEVALGDVVGL